MMNNSILYPDSGCFESMRAYNGDIFVLDAHLKRLFASCKSLFIDPGVSREALEGKILERLKKSRLKDAYIRISARPGKGKTDIDIMVKEFKPYSARCYEKGVEIMVVVTQKHSGASPEPKVKSSDFLPGVMAKIDAQKEGVFEAVMLNDKGFVAEGTVSNIFIVKGRKLFTPAAQSGILEGVTRGLVIGLAGSSGIKTQETVLTRHDLYNADEVFLTNTSMEIMPVRVVDKREIGQQSPGEITKKLMVKFKTEVSRDGKSKTRPGQRIR